MAPGYYKGLKWNIFRSSSSFTRTDKTWWVCRALGLAFVWKLRDASKAASSPLPEPPPTPLTAAALQRHEERVLERDKCNKTMFREFEDSMFHCLMNRTCFKLQWDCEASVEGSHATIARWFFPGCNGATQPKMVSVCVTVLLSKGTLKQSLSGSQPSRACLGLCISVGKAAESIQNTSPLNW